MYPGMYFTNTELLREFRKLSGIVFTFVSDWGYEEIDLNTYRLYGRKIPAQEATSLYMDQVRNFLNGYEIIDSKLNDVKIIFTLTVNGNQHQYNLQNLNKKFKEPKTIIFLRGDIYKCTFNVENKLRTSQIRMVLDLPSQYELGNL